MSPVLHDVTLLAYTGAVLMITLWPSPPDVGSSPVVERLLAWVHDAGVPEGFDLAALELTANVAMFVPLGLLLASSARVSAPWLAVLAGLALSATVETVQIVLPGRVPTAQDVVANTAGAALGASVVVAHRALRRRRARRAGTAETAVAAGSAAAVTPSGD